MESSTTERVAGIVTAVYGTHIFVESKDRKFYVHRDQLAFCNPCIGMPVSFVPGKQHTSVSLPCALAVKKA
jgi:hypothetical protein